MPDETEEEQPQSARDMVPYAPIPFAWMVVPVLMNDEPMVCLEVTHPLGENTIFFTPENAASMASQILKITRNIQVHMSAKAKLVSPEGKTLIK